MIKCYYYKSEVISVKKILIDLDDTILVDCYLEVVNKYLKKNYTYDDIKDYWVDEIVPEKSRDKYLKYFYNDINIYDFGKINEGAIETIENLTKYYEVFICSAYIDYRDIANCSKILIHKHKWLIENLPFIKPENFIFTNRKDVIPTDIKIDDKIENLKNCNTKLLITAYHNKNISEQKLKEENIIRVNSWMDIAEILLNH